VSVTIRPGRFEGPATSLKSNGAFQTPCPIADPVPADGPYRFRDRWWHV